PDGLWLASGGGEGRVLLWNVETRAMEKELYKHPGAVRWIAFDPAHAWVVSACEQGEVRVWDHAKDRVPGNFGEGLLPMPTDRARPKWHNGVFHSDGRSLFAGDG